MDWYYPFIDDAIIICWACHWDFSRKDNHKKEKCPNCGFEGRKVGDVYC